MASLSLQDGQEFRGNLDKTSSYLVSQSHGLGKNMTLTGQTMKKTIKRTWLALGTLIENDFDVYLDGKERLTAAKWQEIVKTDVKQLRLTLNLEISVVGNSRALVLYSRTDHGRGKCSLLEHCGLREIGKNSRIQPSSTRMLMLAWFFKQILCNKPAVSCLYYRRN